MSKKLSIGFALLAGYYLGRRRKLRMAAALALAGLAGRGARGGGGGMLAQGLKTLTSSEELKPVTDRLRGDLMEVGKAAALAAAGKQIDSLSDKLHDRAESLRAPGEKTAPAAEDEAEDDAEDAEDEAEDDAEDEEPEEDEEDTEDEEPEEEAEEPEESKRAGQRPHALRRTGRSRR
ncbi:hypothetical protein [Nonomuraea insulae]|uniref:DNA primase n=1 Tax=Nonomuraea insulae TaxID=1616787 RepID=A0ABW1CD02_9ACTN